MWVSSSQTLLIKCILVISNLGSEAKKLRLLLLVLWNLQMCENTIPGRTTSAMVLENQLLLLIYVGKSRKLKFKQSGVTILTLTKITTWKTFKMVANLPRSGCPVIFRLGSARGNAEIPGRSSLSDASVSLLFATVHLWSKQPWFVWVFARIKLLLFYIFFLEKRRF